MDSDDSGYTPLLPGIGIAGYRSIATWQTFLFDSRVTLLAGVNNCGKSNVLRFVAEVLPKVKSNRGISLDLDTGDKGLILPPADEPKGYAHPTSLVIGCPHRIPQDVDAPTRRRPGSGTRDDYKWAVRRLLADAEDTDDTYWSRLVAAENSTNKLVLDPERVTRAIELWPAWQNQDVYLGAKNALGLGTVIHTEIMRAVLMLDQWLTDIPRIVTINAARRITTSDLTSEPSTSTLVDSLSGSNLIDDLMALQNPEADTWSKNQEKWSDIQKFVQTVVNDASIRISIPASKSTVLVHTPQRVLPLDSLGSGLEQVIILAAAATVTTRSVVCIEEPETNLHPQLQKQLIQYLNDHTDNQYIIATHSAHLLDDKRSSVYHLRLTDMGTTAVRVRKPHEFVEICNDLGYRPSDLLQANCVVWVEGPSDRIYLRCWIELTDPSLIEGVHYSIMFYGGKLLSHLTVDESALDDFIQLRQLNRASAILIDSDKTSPHRHISATKKRISEEFERSYPAPGFSWITRCYTIENYVPADILERAVEQCHPGRPPHVEGQWTNPLGGSFKFDKIAIARAVCDELEPKHLDQYDLRSRATKLVEFIRVANDITVAD